MTNSRKLHFEALEARQMLAVAVVPSVETDSASRADDIAIWIHPTDTSQSTVIGTAKESSSSLRVYDLAGDEIQRVSVPNVNNVDLRYNFPLSGQDVTLLAGSNRSNDSIVIYRIDPQTRLLQNIAARTISTSLNEIYGLAMYVSPMSGKYYVFATSKTGQLQQWELFDDGNGRVDAVLVRSFSVGSISEGVVADDVLGHLYVGEENVGIWKYSAEPDGGSARTRVDSTGGSGHLDADVEGLTIYYAADGTGYLMASSQGNDEFAVYRREGDNAYLGNFELVSGGGIDAVTNTDGIDVVNFPLGSQFPQGLFVAQDNDANFKLARWDAIADAFGGLLSTDLTWDPRTVGSSPAPNPLPGDYNYNGTVDAADYTVWRNTLGTAATPGDGADGSGNGVIDQADYEVWKANYGMTLPPAAAAVVHTKVESATDVGVPQWMPFTVKGVSDADYPQPMSPYVGGVSAADGGPIHRSKSASETPPTRVFPLASSDLLLLLAQAKHPGPPPLFDSPQPIESDTNSPDEEAELDNTALDVSLATWP